MTRRAPLKVIKKLEEALRLAKMERISFGFDTDRLTLGSGPDHGQEHGVTDFIKERTRIYRQTWLIPAIEETLAWAKGK